MKEFKKWIGWMLVLMMIFGMTSQAFATEASNPVVKKAFIPIFGGTSVNVLDLSTDEIDPTLITAGNRPISGAITPDGTKVLISNYSSQSVTVVNTADNSVLTTFPLPTTGPTGIAYNETGTRAYVACYDTSKVHIVDMTNNYDIIDSISVSNSPAEIVAGNNKLYVACENGYSIDVIDMDTNEVTSISLGSFRPFGLAIDPSLTKLYAGSRSGSAIAVIDLSDNNAVTQVAVGVSPNGVGVSPDGTKVYTANTGSNSVSVVDTSNNTVVDTITDTANPISGPVAVGVSLDGSKIYTVNSGNSTMSVISTSSNAVIKTLTLSGGTPQFVFGSFMAPVVVPVQIPPEAVNSTVYGNADTTLTFSVADFVYSDTQENPMESIKITSLPEYGTLKVGSVAASVYEEVYWEDIGTLTFVPDVNWSGQTSFNWKVSTGSNYSTSDASMTIIIYDVKSSEANLASITLSAGTLSPVFSPSITGYTASVDSSVSSITVTASVYESTYSSLKINGISYNSGETSQNISLSTGTNMIPIVVTAEDGTTTKTYTINVTRAAAPSDSDSSDSSDSPSLTSPLTTNNDAVLQINGKSEIAGTSSTNTRNGQTVTTITVDPTKLKAKLASEGKGTVVTIPVSTGADVSIGLLNGQIIKDMEDSQAVLEIKTDLASYKLPAKLIDIDGISEQIGKSIALSDIKVQVEIGKPTAETLKIIENAAKKGEFTLVAPSVEFTVTCTNGGQTISLNKFNAYVERTIAMPDGVDVEKITTGIVVEADGTVRHVPTKIVKIDGHYYAKINSLTNSIYSVVWHPLTFKDVEGHWAKEAINDLGSRMVISGMGNDTFDPDRAITRGEFAAIIVKALGLKPGMGSNPFTDVEEMDWYSGFIKTAAQYNILSGYGNGKFGPMDPITREQAMTMIAKTMKITGLDIELEAGEAEKLLGAFKDGDQSADYAKDSIITCLKAGVVSGRDDHSIASKDNVTRAEVAVIIRRLLQKSDLI